MNIGIASDHGGFILKEKIIKYLEKKGYSILDYGTDNNNDSVDYPDFALKICEALNEEKISFGIVICKTGIGMSIACNKIKGIRCAKVSNEEETKYSRLHNDSNIIALSSKLTMIETKDIVDTFLTTNFSNEERHIRRIEKISEMENHK